MQVNQVPPNTVNFKGAMNNKVLLKSLEKISEHGTSFAATTSLVMSLGVRPLAIASTPDVEKENKQYAIANSLCSGIVKFGLVEAVALPVENAVKKIDEKPHKYLNHRTITNLKGEGASLATSRSYKLGTQIMKLGTGFITAIPKSMLTIALIPVIMDKVFNLKPFAPPEKNASEKTMPGQAMPENAAPKQSAQEKPVPENADPIAFKRKPTEKLAKGLGRILNSKTYQNFLKKNQSQDKDIAKHLSAGTDILLTTSFAVNTNASDKIKENRKKALIYNNVISTTITLAGGYGVDSLVKKKSEKFVENFAKANKNDPKLHKYIEGLHIIRPALIFAGIYYGVLPMFSTYMAEKIDKHLNKGNA